MKTDHKSAKRIEDLFRLYVQTAFRSRANCPWQVFSTDIGWYGMPAEMFDVNRRSIYRKNQLPFFLITLSQGMPGNYIYQLLAYFVPAKTAARPKRFCRHSGLKVLLRKIA
jgi:hypothetical protein